MRSNCLLILGSLIAALFITTGCSSPVDQTFEFETKNIKPTLESNSVKTMYIRSFNDSRNFDIAESTIHPEQMTISSYSPDQSYTKSRIIARNQSASACSSNNSVAGCTAEAKTFSSLAENLCFREYPAKEYVKLAIEKGMEQAGYRILSRETDINKYTLVLDLTLNRFWYWIDYDTDDRYAHTDIEVSFHTKDENNGSERNFKISNRLNMKVLGFMSPLKGTVESALVDYSETLAKNIQQRLQ